MNRWTAVRDSLFMQYEFREFMYMKNSENFIKEIEENFEINYDIALRKLGIVNINDRDANFILLNRDMGRLESLARQIYFDIEDQEIDWNNKDSVFEINAGKKGSRKVKKKIIIKKQTIRNMLKMIYLTHYLFLYCQNRLMKVKKLENQKIL